MFQMLKVQRRRDLSLFFLLLPRSRSVIITTVLYLSDALRKNFLSDSFDYKVWDSYFCLSVIFINQPCLQLESFSPSKRKKILEK
ncbi:dedicator of cytokinesis protein 4-like [Cynoglossus semilaevis]|uniref:dedicator of cytokinesis protein 4-like n=1 Tax=Cynoglossus semilaevis TaxID=244447 RepID=UPI000D6273AC|nr:dedicator of cytokinesis protein 4-like [Cynoglossus semilaevis]